MGLLGGHAKDAVEGEGSICLGGLQWSALRMACSRCATYVESAGVLSLKFDDWLSAMADLDLVLGPETGDNCISSQS